jgi:hypothetical protein
MPGVYDQLLPQWNNISISSMGIVPKIGSLSPGKTNAIQVAFLLTNFTFTGPATSYSATRPSVLFAFLQKKTLTEIEWFH